MLNYQKKFYEYKREAKKIRVAIFGAGFMGKAMVSQYIASEVIDPAVVVSRNIEDVLTAYTDAGVSKDKILICDEVKDIDSNIERGYYTASDNSELLYKNKRVDFVIDATGDPVAGAELAYNAIMNGKNIISLNLEADVCVGSYLHLLAKERNLIYTGIDGDEPGSVIELYNEARLMGFEVLAMGKGKNNKLNYSANMNTVREEAELKGLKNEMLASFVDGTKTMIELAAMSNASGFNVDVPGGHGIESDIRSLVDYMRLKEEGGILNKYEVVDYVNGIAPGVFVVVRSDLKRIDHLMKFLKMGKGPNYVLYKPYHLTSIETVMTVLKAYFDRTETIAPLRLKPYADVAACIKKDMKKNEHFDFIGGETYYGKVINYEDSIKNSYVPISLIDNKAVLKRDMKKGEIIKYTDIMLNEDNLIFKLRMDLDRRVSEKEG